ncbi:hypothetical protein CHS0354_019607, partial [Potamilus streckersoni]
MTVESLFAQTDLTELQNQLRTNVELSAEQTDCRKHFYKGTMSLHCYQLDGTKGFQSAPR